MNGSQETNMQFISEITVKYVQHMGNDATLAAAAKVLEPEAYQEYLQTHEERSVEGLLNYLIQHRHGTPFEHAGLSVYAHCPIFVWREWHRHRIGFSYNEESGRYKTLEPVFYVPPRNRPMIKVENWKPGRPKFLTLDEEAKANLAAEYHPDIIKAHADEKYKRIVEGMKLQYQDEYEWYLKQLEEQLDPGLARDNLPVGIYSSCWVTCNPRSLMAFLSLRTHEPEALKVSYPLYEIEAAAREVEDIFARLWPITHAAFCKHGRLGP